MISESPSSQYNRHSSPNLANHKESAIQTVTSSTELQKTGLQQSTIDSNTEVAARK